MTIVKGLPRTLGLSPRRLFRLLAVAETITWSLLIAGMLLKYVARGSDLGVSIGGGVHGFVFLAYCAATVFIAVNQRWTLHVTLTTLASAVIPYATIPAERRLERDGLLEGGWRREATDDPRDNGVLSRLLRWALSHPMWTSAALVVGVVVVFAVLLMLGPPGGGAA
jgi:integral membrane protein